MTPPYYTLAVTSLTAGWSYSVTHGDVPNPLVKVHLLDPFKLTWGFEGEQIPAQLEPKSVSFNFLCSDAASIPEIQVGDLVTIDLRIGAAGARIVQATFRVTQTTAQLDDASVDPFPVTAEVVAIAVDVDWFERVPGQFYNVSGTAAQGKRRFRERLAELTWLCGLSMGVPSTWANIESPATDANTLYPMADYTLTYGDSSLRTHLRRTLHSFMPQGNTHAFVTKPSSGYPAGYGWVGPAAGTWDTSNPGYVALTDPGSSNVILAVPTSRSIPSTAGLPFVFAVDSGQVVIVPVQPPAGAMTQLGLDAAWCVLPTKARRARDRGNSAARLRYYAINVAPAGTSGDAVYVTYGDYSRGIVFRDVETDLQWNDPPHNAVAPALPAAGAYFLSDASTLGGTWAYDQVSVIASRMPDAIAAFILPRLLPRTPGETDGDGCLVRHLTITQIAPDLRFGDGAPALGFVTGGSLTIAGGEMTFDLNMTPGAPRLASGTLTPVTVGDVQAGAYGLITVANVDAGISIGELDYVDA